MCIKDPRARTPNNHALKPIKASSFFAGIWNRVGCAPEDANTSKGFKTFTRMVKPCDSKGVNPPTTRKQLVSYGRFRRKSVGISHFRQISDENSHRL